MTNEDRDMLIALRQQQVDLQQMLDRLTAQLVALEARTGAHAAELFLPPVPPEAFLPPLPEPLVELPPLPTRDAAADLPPIPTLPPVPAVAPQPEISRWLVRIGVAFGLLFLALLAGSLDVAFHIDQHLGLLGRFGLLGLGSAVVLFIGDRFDRSAGHSFFGRLLLVAGVLGLYLAFGSGYALAMSGKVPHPLVGGVLLLLVTIYALLLAERRKSQVIGGVGILLGYVSTAIVPVTGFSLGCDLVLAATAAAFLLRNGWTTLAAFGATAAYLTLLHRLVFNSYGDLVLDTSRTLPFLPPAVYLLFTWAFFTTAIILCTAHAFRGGKRFFLASLNNASLAFLLALSAYIAGYGLSSVGWALFDSGILLLIVSRFAGFAEQDPVDLMGTYAAQGLGLFTAGIIIVFTGITRAVLLLLETLLFGIAGAFAGDRVLTVSTYAAGFFATVFSIWQIAVYAHHPWLLGLGGALIMLINAWARRGEVRHSPIARSHTVISTTCYCLMALGLIIAAFNSEFTDASLPVALALGALALTFAIYHVSIFELPAVAQILMLAALVLVLFPIETGEELPGWTLAIVGISTLVLLTWWARQRLMIRGPWVVPVNYLYALGLIYLVVLTLRPYLDAQSWMVAESILSVVFLVYGALFRVWPLAVSGQALLLLALCHVFFPPDTEPYSWSGIAAALPILVTFVTARAALRWLRLFPELAKEKRDTTRFVAGVYQAVALLALARGIFGIVPAAGHLAAFLFLGTFLLGQNVRRPDSFGVRASLLLSALGLYVCVTHDGPIATGLNAFAVLLLVAQTVLLIPARSLLSAFESWFATLAAIFTGWYFTSLWAWPQAPGAHSHLSLAWAILALFLFVLGLLAGQRRLRWCGLAVLFAAMLHVVCVDLWTLPVGLRIVTLLLLVIISAGIGVSLLWRNEPGPPYPPKNL